MSTKIINGWEYMTNTYPNSNQKQNLQELYLINYNEAYVNFVNSICFDKQIIEDNINKLGYKTNKYQIVINCFENNDIINDNDYPIKFLKSKFLKNKLKKIKSELINHYKKMDYYVKGPYKNINDNNYCIELCWNN